MQDTMRHGLAAGSQTDLPAGLITFGLGTFGSGVAEVCPTQRAPHLMLVQLHVSRRHAVPAAERRADAACQRRPAPLHSERSHPVDDTTNDRTHLVTPCQHQKLNTHHGRAAC